MSSQEFSHSAKGESSNSIIKAAASQDNCPDCGLPEEKHRLSAKALAAYEEDKAEENPGTCETAAEITSHLESL